MRATIRNYTAAVKARRQENGEDEGGFSLIELIVVVVILGILAAIAVPVFSGLQDQAKQSALESIVGNAASQTASDIAKSKDESKLAGAIKTNLDALAAQSADQLTGIKLENTKTTAIDGYCISGTTADIETAVTSGPGC